MNTLIANTPIITSNYSHNKWSKHFEDNLKIQRIDWTITPKLSETEKNAILASLQAWQLGETSDGKNLLKAVEKFAIRYKNFEYIKATQLFIKEEQKHGNNLGKYLDLIGEKRIKKNWGDSLFRYVRYFNTDIEIWTFTVIVVESTAQLFYHSLKEATQCMLLKQICTDILIDEAHHIKFQYERLQQIYDSKSAFGKSIAKPVYFICFYVIILTVWLGHQRLFMAGGNSFEKYLTKMTYKYNKTLKRITATNNLPITS
jgi:hypothetical protein